MQPVTTSSPSPEVDSPWNDGAVAAVLDPGALDLPSGTVAFLLSDVEGSTASWERDAEAMAAGMRRHDEIFDAAITARGGVRPTAQGEGDSVVGAFARASDAILAARDIQRALAAETWPMSEPMRVRMAVHTGEARFIGDRNYAGHAIIRTARLRGLAHGGQVLVSAVARDLTIDQIGDEVAWLDLGEHRLRDLTRPERVWQLVADGLDLDFAPLVSLDSLPHNLPTQLSTFIGRVDEQLTLTRLLATERLVSIVGAGGAGKTRLAQQVAAEVLPRHHDGVWWVELAEVFDPAALVGVIAAAIGVNVESGPADVDQLCTRLAERELLVVLDNCEHLVAVVAVVVDRLLRSCPRIHILTTSREALDIGGELAWRIPPLGVPTGLDGSSPALEAVAQYDAVRLFLDRAQRVRSNFHLDDTNAADVAQICVQLDGIPLAIELAAARCRSLTPERIRLGLADAFALLTGGGRLALPRQQTLAASIAWSHDLLSDAEQVLLRRLSVFNGGCRLDDAEAIVGDDLMETTEVLDLLDRLVAQSLVQLDDESPVARYRLLETVRQYADQRLRDAGEHETFRARHAQHFLDTIVALSPRFETSWSDIAFAWAVDELDNLSAALASLTDDGRFGDAARLVWAMHMVWALVAPTTAQRSVDELLERAGGILPADALARLHQARADACNFVGDMLGAFVSGSAALEAAEQAGDESIAARGVMHMATATLFLDPPAGIEMARVAAARSAGCGDVYNEMICHNVEMCGLLLVAADIEAGVVAIEETLELVERVDNPVWLAWIEAAQALAAAYQGYQERAEHFGVSAENRLRHVASLSSAPTDTLLTSSTMGCLAHFARSYGTYSADRPSPLHDQLADRAARARRDGFIQAAILFELANGVYLVSDGAGPDVVEDGRAALSRAAEVARASGSMTILANVVPYLSDVALDAGNLDEAAEILAEIPMVVVDGSRLITSRFRIRQSLIALDRGEVVEAERLAHESLDALDGQDIAWETFHTLEVLAQIGAATGDPTDALRLVGAATRLREERVRRQLDVHVTRIDRLVDAARAALGPEASDAALAEGRSLDMAAAVAYARRSRGDRRRPAVGWDSLTPTELAVVDAAAEGLTNPQIAERLLMSRETVKTHLSHVFSKLSVQTRAELARRATERGATLTNPGSPASP